MKKMTFVIAIAAIIFVMLPAIRKIFDRSDSPDARPAAPTAVLEGGSIVVRGPGNTLATIAAQLGLEDAFRYDPERKTAVCRGNISVEGELIIGDPKGEGLTETLEFSTRVCGDCMIFVLPQGSLKVHNAEISTVDRSAVVGLCPKGYGILGQGEVVMRNARLSYMSGSSSTIFSGQEARGVLERVVSYGGETNAVSWANIRGGNIAIEKCNFLAVGNWGAWVGRTVDAPLVVNRTVFAGKAGDLLVQGSANLVLVDCQFRPDKVSFAEQAGSVAVRWTRRFRVIDPETGRPVAGAQVAARSRPGAPLEKTAATTTDADGFASIILTEYEATPRHPTRADGVNNAAPYDITFKTANGHGTTVIVDPHRPATNDECTTVKIAGGTDVSAVDTPLHTPAPRSADR